MSEANEKALVAQILSSYLSNNTVAAADLPSVIDSVQRAFVGSGGAVSTTSSDSLTKTWQPAVPVKKSVTPDAVICLCCGERFKTLRRHLQTTHQLNPREYRAISESVLRDFNGLRRHFRVGGDGGRPSRSSSAVCAGTGKNGFRLAKRSVSQRLT
jgi:predicted transcriptional regulator